MHGLADSDNAFKELISPTIDSCDFHHGTNGALGGSITLQLAKKYLPHERGRNTKGGDNVQASAHQHCALRASVFNYPHRLRLPLTAQTRVSERQIPRRCWPADVYYKNNDISEQGAVEYRR